MIKQVKASLSEKVLLIFLILLILITFGSYFLLKDKCLFVKNIDPNKINFTNSENIAIITINTYFFSFWAGVYQILMT